LGDTFRWKGENVATTEVEAVANEYPGVEHSVAYGVELPGTDGRAGMAALTLKSLDDFDLAAFSRHLKEKLPAYAVPLFIRLRQQEEITGTFKYRKVELKKESFDISVVDDPVYVLLPGGSSYSAVSAAEVDQIRNEAIRF